MATATIVRPTATTPDEALRDYELALLGMRMAFRRATELAEVAECHAGRAYQCAISAHCKLERAGELSAKIVQSKKGGTPNAYIPI